MKKTLLLLLLLASPAFAADWTGSVTSITKASDGLSAQVQFHFTNGVDKVDIIEPYFSDLSDAAIKRYVFNWTSQRNKVEQLDVSKVIGPVDTTPPAPPAPSADDLARSQFVSDVQILVGLQKAVKLGFGDAGAVSTQLGIVKAQWKAEYAPLLIGIDLSGL